MPAKPSDVITIFGTSFGTVDPGSAPGEIPAGIAAVIGTVKVTLGAVDLAPANILYAGVTPGNPGLYQLNLIVPGDTPDGDLAIVLSIGGLPTPAGAYLTVKSAQ